jgi:hypothetical protein
MHLTRTREDSGAGGVPEERSTDNTSSEQPAIAPTPFGMQKMWLL